MSRVRVAQRCMNIDLSLRSIEPLILLAKDLILQETKLFTMTFRRVVMVTGGNTGIGYEAIKALLQSPRPYQLLLGSRSLWKAKQAIVSLQRDVPVSESRLETIQIDVCNDTSIATAAQTVLQKYGHVDALVNNAGRLPNLKVFGMWLNLIGALFDYGLLGVHQLRDIFSRTYDVNVTGTHAVTHTFAPLLLRSSDPRLLFVTSSLSNLTALSRAFVPEWTTFPKGWPKPPAYPAPTPVAYRSSKAALNMIMLNWHWMLRNDNVKVWGVSPGLLATGLGGDPSILNALGAEEPGIGGQLIRYVIEGERDSDVGKIVSRTGIQGW